MKNQTKNYERGQSLVLMVVLMVALVGMLALALNAGYLYNFRRGAQNAADAGALAGARAYCLNITQSYSYRATQAISAASDYAINRNPILGATGQTANVVVDDANAEVTVTVTVNYNTLLSGGANDLTPNKTPTNTVQAIAAARCFPADTAEGALPIAKFCDPNGVDPQGNPNCGIDFGAMDGTCDVGIDKFVVFMNESNGNANQDVGDISDETATYWCEKWPNKPTGSIAVNCDIPGGIPDDDSSNDIEPVMTSNPTHNWIWVDLSPNAGAYPKCSNSDCLKDEVEGTKAFPVSTHTWVYGGSGGHTSVYKAIEDYRIAPGDYVIVPIFDDRCMGNPETPSADCAGRTHAQDKYYVPAGVNNNDVFFHLNTFAIFKVTCVDDGGKGKCTARNNMFDQSQGSEIKDPNKVKSFEGCFVGGFMPNMSGQSDSTYITGAFTVYLSR